MKKGFIALAAALVFAFALTGCATTSSQSSESSVPSMSASDISESSEASSSEAAPTVSWTTAKSADEAAKGAGIDNFGVMDKIKINDTDFANPTFSYTDGVAQAAYETGATALFVRKAEGEHKAPITDRDKTDFAESWSQDYNGIDVTCYGASADSATVVTWADGTDSYGVTFQGLGGEEVGMTSDEVAAVVKGVEDANDNASNSDASQQASQDSDDDDDDDNDSGNSDNGNVTISEGDAEAAAEGVSGGEAVDAYTDYIDGHGWCWVVTVQAPDGTQIVYYVDNYGNPYNAEFDENSSSDLTISQGDAEAAAEAVSGGKAIDAYSTQTDDHGMCWYVTVQAPDGTQIPYYVDNDGNAFNAEPNDQ